MGVMIQISQVVNVRFWPKAAVRDERQLIANNGHMTFRVVSLVP